MAIAEATVARETARKATKVEAATITAAAETIAADTVVGVARITRAKRHREDYEKRKAEAIAAKTDEPIIAQIMQIKSRMPHRNIPQKYIDDLHTLSAGFAPSDFSSPGNVHYSKAGYEKLARQVASSIRAAL